MNIDKRTLENAGIELLNTSEAARLLRVSEGTLRSWRRRGKGPQWLALGPDNGTVRYTLAAISDYIARSYVRVPVHVIRASAQRAMRRGL